MSHAVDLLRGNKADDGPLVLQTHSESLTFAEEMTI